MFEKYLSSGLDIDLTEYKLGIIKQPKVRDLLRLPFNESDLVFPFIMIENQYREFKKKENFEFDIKKIDMIPILSSLGDNSMFSFSYKILTLISMLYNCEIEEIEIIPDEDGFYFFIKDIVVINEDNFDMFLNVVFEIFIIDFDNIKFIEDEWVENTGSEKEKKMIAFFKEKERKRREREKLYLHDYVNFLVVRDRRNFDDLLGWTYYQIINIYRLGSYYHRTEIDEKIFCSFKTTMTSKDVFNWEKEFKKDFFKE